MRLPKTQVLKLFLHAVKIKPNSTKQITSSELSESAQLTTLFCRKPGKEQEPGQEEQPERQAAPQRAQRPAAESSWSQWSRFLASAAALASAEISGGANVSLSRI